jgi:hypothetical protein
MTRCPMSRAKRRNQLGKGKSLGYKLGMKGHAYKKLFNDNSDHIGRECTKCGLVIFNAYGKYLKSSR